jgi:arylsulfatase A-like enzyme
VVLYLSTTWLLLQPILENAENDKQQQQEQQPHAYWASGRQRHAPLLQLLLQLILENVDDDKQQQQQQQLLVDNEDDPATSPTDLLQRGNLHQNCCT